MNLKKQSRKLPQNQLGNREVPKSNTQKLPFGKAGNLETLKVMKKVARDRSGHPKIRQLAINIINQANTKSHNYICEAKAIGEWVKKHIAYVRDANGIEQLHDPLTMIDQIQRGVCRGDCDDMSLMIATLLLAIGGKPKFRCVRYQSGKATDSFNHIYVVVYDKQYRQKEQRVSLDAIIKDKPMGYEVKHLSGEEFDI